MKTKKVTGLLFVLMIAVHTFCGTAIAEEKVTVPDWKNGGTLWDISRNEWGTGRLYTLIAERNNIADPSKIKKGQELIIPDLASVELRNHLTLPYGAEGVKADAKVIDFISQTSIDKNIKDQLVNVVKSSDPEVYVLMKGESAYYVSDGKGIYGNGFTEFKFNWKKVDHLASHRWSAVIDNTAYEVIVIDSCGNVNLRWKKLPPQEQPPTAELTPIVPAEQAETPWEEPDIVAEEYVKVEYPESEPSRCSLIEHEPIIGAGVWGNKIAKGNFAYAEYLLWLKNQCESSEYSYGVGFYGNIESGDSKISDYEWGKHWGDSYGIGPQVGVKRTFSYLDDNGVPRFQQWGVKSRLVWEHTYGENTTSGYHAGQDTLKLGVYADYLRELNDKWLFVTTLEGWHPLESSIDSSWKGDSPSDRGNFALGVFGQRKLTDSWQIRSGLSLFHQNWDDLTGLRASSELRWKDIVMFGPYVNFYPFGISATHYPGMSASDLTTLGGFVRLELWSPIRQWKASRGSDRVSMIR